MTPEQQFASDVTSQVPSISGYLASGSLTTASLNSMGDTLCNDMAAYTTQYSTQSQTPQEDYTSAALTIDGGPGFQVYQQEVPNLSRSDAYAITSLAFQDICPSYTSDIPYGSPGAP